MSTFRVLHSFLRRNLCIAVAAALIATGAHAQQDSSAAQYPARPVKIVVPFAAGGAPDLVARLIGQKLAERLGQSFVSENRTGAGGNLAMEYVAHAPADGYTLVLASDAPLAINPYVYPKLPFDPVKDFAPVGIVASIGFMLLACPSLPVSQVADLVALAKARPLSYASSGFGTNHHLAGEMLKQALGIDITHIPYKGFGQGVSDVVGCKVDIMFGAISSGLPHVRAGKLKPLAVTIPARHPNLPAVMTMTEAGFPGVAMDAWFGLAAPAGTPRAVIEKLSATLMMILRDKDLIERFAGAGIDVMAAGPEQFAARLQADLARFGVVAKSLKAKVE